MASRWAMKFRRGGQVSGDHLFQYSTASRWTIKHFRVLSHAHFALFQYSIASRSGRRVLLRFAHHAIGDLSVLYRESIGSKGCAPVVMCTSPSVSVLSAS